MVGLFFSIPILELKILCLFPGTELIKQCEQILEDDRHKPILLRVMY